MERPSQPQTKLVSLGMYCALANPDVKVEVDMPSNQMRPFLEVTLASKDLNLLSTVIDSISIEDSVASQPSDRSNILKSIEKGVGFQKANDLVRSRVRSWYLFMLSELAGAFTTKSEQDTKARVKIGERFLSLGESVKADELFQESARICSIEFGPTHPHSIAVVVAIATAYQLFGYFDKAIEANLKVLTINLSTVGPDHFNTAQVYGTLGHLYRSKSDFEKAMTFFTKELEIGIKNLGQNSPKHAENYRLIAQMHSRRGDYENELTNLRKCFSFKLAALGPSHPEVGELHFLVGISLSHQQQRQEARVEFASALKIFEAAYGPDHESTKKTRNQLELPESVLASVVKEAFPRKFAVDHPLGCSIEFFRYILSEFTKEMSLQPLGATLTLETATTTDLCNFFVIPRTKAKICALIELYRDKQDATGHNYFGPAEVFVSHAWKYIVTEVSDVLEQFEKLNPKTYFWFDLFVNNQNIAATLPVEWWSTTFRESIKNIGTVLLVLSPWNDPIPIKRAWCLWEIMCALTQEGVKMEVMLPAAQRNELRDGVFKNFSSVTKALSRIQAEKAEAFKKTDKEMIFKVISDTVGFDVVNQKLKDQLRLWYVRVMASIASTLDGTVNQKIEGDLLVGFGAAFGELGMLKHARPMLERAREYLAAAYGDVNHHELGSCYQLLGECHFHEGNGDKALEIYHMALKSEIAHDSSSQEVASIYSGIGSVYGAKQEFDKAIAQFEKALAVISALKEKKEVVDSALVLMEGVVSNNLGNMYLTKADFDQAIVHCSKGLDALVSHQDIGPDHPETATIYNNLGLSYQSKGQSEKAIEYLSKSLRINLSTVGPLHPMTSKIYGNLGLAFECTGDIQKCIEYHEKSLKICLESQGLMSADTEVTYNNLGVTYSRLGQYDKAIEYLTQSLMINISLLGPTHVRVAETFSTVGMQYYYKSDKANAKLNFQKAAAILALVEPNGALAAITQASLSLCNSSSLTEFQ